MSYKNSVTFLGREPVESIEPDDLLELDGYAFSKQELISYAHNMPQSALINPETHSAFSATAIQLLLNIPEIKVEIDQYKAKQADSKALIGNDVVANLATMLHQIHDVGIDGADDPRIEFLTGLSSRSELEQEAVMNYQIKIKRDSSAMMRERSEFSEAGAAFGKSMGAQQEVSLSVRQALQGGSQSTPCVKTLQIYLWKLVTELDPQLSSEIPLDIQVSASSSGYHLSPRSGSPTMGRGASFFRYSPPSSPSSVISLASDSSLASISEDEVLDEYDEETDEAEISTSPSGPR